MAEALTDIAPLRLPVPAARRRGFALTPLADVMFQLLLFFMLTSSLAPYALLPLSAAGPSAGQTLRDTPTPPQSPAPPAEAQVIWHLERGEIRAGQVRIPLSALPEAVAALRRDAVSDLVVFVTRTAEARDLALLIENVQDSGIARVQLVGT
ncbi:biopolymer transporter ExbD [Roseibaca sp. V10]|uniref:Biopolymer transporter ExbD n=1 Tax=Roseinatronobacter domitianus TaxID=2940293 RepID=A0ABT0M2W3_9RHOB|nr:biopolymer transporter ExbD [Roseibaca domitiana]MCL1629191.1 biopolymer transporter ExbD [Roseibaca domitiana]